MNYRLPGTPLSPLLLTLTAGILGAVFLPVNFLWIAVAEVVAVAVCLLLKRRGAGVMLLGAVCGTIAGGVAKPAHLDIAALNSAGRYYSARVTEVRNTAASQRLTVDVDSVGSQPVEPFRVMVIVRSFTPPVQSGDVVHFTGILRGPSEQVSPFPGGVDMQEYYFRNRIVAVAPGIGEDDIRIVGYKPTFATRMEGWRDRVETAIINTGMHSDTAEFLIAVLTGDRRFLDEETVVDFRNAGLSHVMALSGTHVAVIAFIISLIFFPLRFWGKNRWQWMATIAVLWLYAMLTGLAPSVTRAVIMATFLLLGRILRRQTDPFNSLCAAAIILLIFRPYDLFSVGFQLTFLAVIGILMFARVPDRLRGSVVRVVVGWVTLSLGAVAMTAPLSAYYFHQFPGAFLLSNLPMGVLLPAFMVCGLLAVLLAIVGIPAGFMIAVTDAIYQMCTQLAQSVADIPGSLISIGSFPWWLLTPYYMGVVMLWVAIKRRNVAAGARGVAVAVFGIVLTGLWPSQTDYPDEVRLHNEYAVGIVACEGPTAYLFTDANFSTLRSLTAYVNEYGDSYFRAKGTRDVRLARNGLKTGHLVAGEGYWSVYGKRYVILPGFPDGKQPKHVDYLLLTLRYKGDMEADLKRFAPDTVIISPRLNPRHAAAVAEQLRAKRQPYKMLH